MKLNIILSTPMYGGMANGAYIASCMRLQSLLSSLNINFSFCFLTNESLITRARNKLCKCFLDNPEASHLLFIDADIEFNPNDIIRMIQADKDIIGCPYACKTILWDKVDSHARNDNFDANSLSMAGLSGVFNKIDNDNDDIITEVYELGTGVMLIKRSVFELIMKSKPNNYILMDSPDDMNKDIESRRYYNFFDTEIENERYLSEDYTFCKKWRELGGKLFLLKDAITKHWGSYGFTYSYNNIYKR